MDPKRKKGEIGDLQDALADSKIDKKKTAIRKIIEAMTRGKDVSMLFTDVVKNMATPDMELKKLIYLYIINYAKSHPDLAIMAINIFRKDAREKSNPFLRALAVRTMGCIRVKQITEYLCDPLKDALKDEDPYVRKTAAICVAKLYEVAPELLEEQGFLRMLENLMNDGNAMVLSNTVAALAQISESKGTNIINLTPHTVQKLLTALGECTEWGQIYILDALINYIPTDPKEAENVLERVSPRLSHSNTGVILSSVKLIMKYLDFIPNPELLRSYCRKLNQPLISLLSNEPEIQYVALKNINLIIQKRQLVFDKDLKIFFCNFNDAIYIKLEKIEILIKLSSLDNIQQILHELKEYTGEVDVEFVKKSVRAIGRCAIKLEKAAEKCVAALWECVKSKVNYVVQESIIVIRDIFRKYPKKYEGLLKDICEAITTLDNPEAKAAFIWIIGEYVETIENSDQLLANFLEGFKDESPIVQHQILNACIKLFLMRPADGNEIIQRLLKMATMENENPDLRDRAYVYWRLLKLDPLLTKKIVFAERPVISDQSYTFDSQLLDCLIENIGTLSSVFQRRPETFVKRLRETQNTRELEENDEDPEELMASVQTTSYYAPEITNPPIEKAESEFADLNLAGSRYISSEVKTSEVRSSQVPAGPPPSRSQIDDLLDMGEEAVRNGGGQSGGGSAPINAKPSYGGQNLGESYGGVEFGGQNQTKNVVIPYSVVFNENQTTAEKQMKGIQVQGAFQREGEEMFLYLKVGNKTNLTLSDFQIKFNANSFKLQPNGIDFPIQPIQPNQINEGRIPINIAGVSDNNPPGFPLKIQVALKCNFDAMFFFVPCSLSVLIVPSIALTPQQYIEENSKPNLVRKQDSLNVECNVEEVKNKFINNNINLVGIRTGPNGQEMMSFSGKLINEITFLLDCLYQNNVVMMQYTVPHPSLTPLVYQAFGFILK